MNAFQPISTCPIEFDIHCSCIQNLQSIAQESPATDSQIPISFVNSLKALWEEEHKRRLERSIITPLYSTSLPYTQSTYRSLGESENDFNIRLENLFLKGNELHAALSPHSQQVNFSQWTQKCIDRQNNYQESFQEFSQRVELLTRDNQIEFPLIVIPEDSRQAPQLDHDSDDEGINCQVDEQSQIDVEDILLTNTVTFLQGDDPPCPKEFESKSNERLAIPFASPHRLQGFLHQVFEDSPVLENNPLTLHMTSKQGRRKRSRRLSPFPEAPGHQQITLSPKDRTPERILMNSLSDHSPFSEFNSPKRTLGFDCEASPQVVHPLSLSTVILRPTYSAPSLKSAIEAFQDSELGWYHSIPHYGRLEDVIFNPSPHLSLTSSHILSSEKGRFGWLPEQIKHKSLIDMRMKETEQFSDRDTLKNLISLSSSSASPHLLNMERVLVPTFSPPLVQDLVISFPHSSEDQIMTPVSSGDSESQGKSTATKRVFFKSRIQSSPMRSQIQTPTQTQGNIKILGMNIRNIDQPCVKDIHVTSKIRGRTTVLSLELFAMNRLDLLPNPKYDSIHCLCWVSMCSVTIGDNEIETKSVGIICMSHCFNLSSSAMRSLIRGSCDLPSDAQIVSVVSERELFAAFIALIRNEIDPDIIVGYEIQKDSWGYLIERATTLGIPILQELSRIPTEKPSSRNEHDKYGEEHESGIHIAGRMTINLWRRMRYELKLFSYTIGSVSRHLLNRSFPEFRPQQLTTWFRDPSTLHRVLRYTYSRAELNHFFIDKLDLIRRISESARLYGVDFYSVISRGSQFKVEAVMLRVAHKKGFLAIAPSKRSVANQAAMAVIPLVMEPQSNFYVDPVVVVDFQSLYPSLIIAYNLCFSTILCQLQPGIIGEEDTTGKVGVLPYPEEYVVKNLFDTFHPSGSGTTPTSEVKSTPLVSPSGAVFVGRDIREGCSISSLLCLLYE
jgi:hypothetical protein